ncbi:SMP-30/gluconolactonase/LRE family protein [Luteipulveratus halotolerans]|uniref:SMP-30/gluconolactonase/LRE family protein n=1 Tax=Luteipulveratus halotolerans TaxID=1631356 RepID=UPI000680D970|nr:hypothetical protein [Luteipulveratus halotolerans]
MAATALALATVATAPTAGATTPTDRCWSTAPTATTFASGLPVLGWRENLELDGAGTMWVSDVAAGKVEGFRPDGSVRASVAVPGPGGIRRGPGGAMYVNYGVRPGFSGAGIVKFDPAQPERGTTNVVSGLSGINGLALDPAGNFYVTREFGSQILKIRPDGSTDEQWTSQADIFGTNGIAYDDGNLYTSAIVDLSSPIDRTPVDDPAAHRTVTDLSPNPLAYKALDDLTVVGDHIYVAAYARGEVIRVDKRTGASCIAATGLITPTSVRAPLAFGSDDPQRTLYVTESSGRIVRLSLPAA